MASASRAGAAQCDVAEAAQDEKFVSRVLTTWNSLDIVVNSAGTTRQDRQYHVRPGVDRESGPGELFRLKSGYYRLHADGREGSGQRNIQINAVALGFVQTAMTDQLSDAVKQSLMKAIPAGRLGTPEDVANTVVFLCSGASDYITGRTLTVDGGMTICFVVNDKA